MPAAGEPGSSDEADVSSANDRYVHVARLRITRGISSSTMNLLSSKLVTRAKRERRARNLTPLFERFFDDFVAAVSRAIVATCSRLRERRATCAHRFSQLTEQRRTQRLEPAARHLAQLAPVIRRHIMDEQRLARQLEVLVGEETEAL